mmetsp:Transcript_54105/g.144644  ORF Transcript_54105/g.144644 Transcript_54105/m.144644 type:complete len:203 (+) Transcript_54105:824-1432(+)
MFASTRAASLASRTRRRTSTPRQTACILTSDLTQCLVGTPKASLLRQPRQHACTRTNPACCWDNLWWRNATARFLAAYPRNRLWTRTKHRWTHVGISGVTVDGSRITADASPVAAWTKTANCSSHNHLNESHKSLRRRSANSASCAATHPLNAGASRRSSLACFKSRSPLSLVIVWHRAASKHMPHPTQDNVQTSCHFKELL